MGWVYSEYFHIYRDGRKGANESEALVSVHYLALTLTLFFGGEPQVMTSTTLNS